MTKCISEFQIVRFRCFALELLDPPTWEEEARTEKPRPVDIAEVIRKSEIVVDPQTEATFRAYRPVKKVGGRDREARLDKIAVYGGQAFGFYSIVWKNWKDGVSERHAWRFKLDQGTLVEDTEFKPSIRPIQQ
ncbi:hypothetical protein CSIRO_3050 [Bradyrhizobiaceae bacterium SG-6C]|nr:hypothetical protein CSIRO_3050 [Bradyrhizobiaceae bacterium SG-6C]